MPEEIPAEGALGPEWLASHATKQIPRDVADLMGIPGLFLVVDSHTHNVMPPGAKHANARPYFEHLSEVLDHAIYMGLSQAVYAETDRRWEIYTPLPASMFILTVVGTSPRNPNGEIVSVYVIGEVTMNNRLNKVDPDTGHPYLAMRKRE